MFPLANSKLQGEWAEVCFLKKAISLGLVVSRPYGDSARYDFITDSGSRLCRVQVKSVIAGRRGSYRVTSACGRRNKRRYTHAQIDVLAVFVIPHRAWYLLPVAAFSPRKTVRFSPRHPRRHRFEHFREAWNLLLRPQARTLLPVTTPRIRARQCLLLG